MAKSSQLCILLVTGLVCYWLGKSHAPPVPSKPMAEVPPKNPPPSPLKKSSDQPRRGSWEPFAGSAQELWDRVTAEGKLNYDNVSYVIKRSLEDLPADQFPAFAASMDALKKPLFAGHGDRILSEFLRLWTMDDPTAAIAWAKSRPADKHNNERRMALAHVARQLSQTDPLAAFQLLKDEPGGLAFDSGGVFIAMARQDLSGALAALEHVSADIRSQALIGIYQEWGTRDPASAVASAAKLTGKDRTECLHRVFSEWSSSDPAAALACLNSLPLHEQAPLWFGGSALINIFASAAQQDPQKALALLDQVPADSRWEALGSLADEWARKDVEAAWKWAGSLANSRERNLALSKLGEGGRKLDAAQTLELANQISNDDNRLEFLNTVLSGSEPNFQKMRAVLQNLDPNERRNILGRQEFFEALMLQPDQAMQLLGHLNVRVTEMYENGPSLIKAWAGKDAASAYEWASSLPAEQQGRFMKDILPNLAATDPAGALAKAEMLPSEDQDRSGIISSILSNWDRHQPGGLSTTVASMTGPLRTEALAVLAGERISKDPAAGAAEILRLAQSNRPEDVAVSKIDYMIANIGRGMAIQDPAQAIAMISQLPNQEMRAQFIEGLTSSWAADDALSASKWVVTLPAGVERDAAVSSLVEAIQSSDPASAVTWASQIQDEQKRERGLESALHVLKTKDPAAAKTATEAAPISAKRKAEWLARFDTN